MVYYKLPRNTRAFLALSEARNMPSYDFKCVSCGHRFELFTTISQRATAVCPKCGGPVARVYEGKWSMGVKPVTGGCACGGNCAGCAGCGK